MSERTWKYLVTVGFSDTASKQAWMRFLGYFRDTDVDEMDEAIRTTIMARTGFDEETMDDLVTVRVTPLAESPEAIILISRETGDRIAVDGLR